MCHHKAPHREWEPALSHLADYDGVKFPEPPTLFDDYSGRGKAEHEQEMMIAKALTPRDLKLTPPPTLNAEQRKIWDAYYEPRNDDFRKQNLTGQDLVRWKYQRYMHDYLATIASVDESVGKLLDYLDKEGLAENTIVVYSSDQGFFLGEHGWFDKRWIFEESLRTPLVVRWPGIVKPGSINATSSRISISPRRCSMPPASRCRRKCRAAASCRSSKAKRRPTGAKAFTTTTTSIPGRTTSPGNTA